MSTAGALEQTDRRALLSIAVQFFVNGAVVASYVPRLPEIRDEIGADLATVGQILAVATLGGVVGSVVVGRTTNRFGTRRTMLGGAFALVLLLPFVSTATAPWQLLLVLAAVAGADVFTDVAMNMQASRLSARRRIPVMNRLHGMWSLGTVVGGLAAAGMAELGIGLRAHLIGASTLLAIALVFVAPGLLATDPKPSPTADRGGRRAATRLVVVFAALGAAAIVPEMINSDWAAFRMTDDLGSSESVAGLAYVAFTVGMVGGRMAGDTFAAVLGGSTLLRVATALAIGGTALATLPSSTGGVFVGLVLAGSGVSVMFPQLYDAAARTPHPGASLGALTAGTRLALFAAPAVVGALADSEPYSVGEAIALVTIPASILVLLLSSRIAEARNARPAVEPAG